MASTSKRPLLHPALPRIADTVIRLDGADLPARIGESLITALLAAGEPTGRSEFDGGDRCGFCLMGACQDCTLWTEAGQRLRACMTPVQAGMRLRRTSPLADAARLTGPAP